MKKGRNKTNRKGTQTNNMNKPHAHIYTVPKSTSELQAH